MTDAGEKLSNRAKRVAAVFAGELTAAWERAIFAQSGSALPLRFEGHVRHVERCIRVSSGRSRFSRTSSSRLGGRQFDDPAYPQVPRIEAGIGLGDPIPKPCAPVDSRSDGPQRVTGHNLVAFAAAASGDPRLRAFVSQLVGSVGGLFAPSRLELGDGERF